ncbi:ABC transporter permease [Methylomicrobium sp. Wu6]|uniref:ABC transporter permease n=1 Tax=Methylomicrobium sp. Wu6 TaxID=3107928 RepID=UPI002DD630F2|nr:ABC transporter permease [Methylomicrobium sp. Wu6]MEC4750258.1 ABC transporter permease [Methylomicrobium sp. Wu6]
MIVLWTDALIFLLIVMTISMGVYVRGKEHFRRPLRQITASKNGMISLTVLVFFVLIGLIDSIHFKASGDDGNDVISVLDYWAAPLRQHGEKTYSAPFAAFGYGKEMVTLDDGTAHWDYPRLKYGGAHLSDPERELTADILKKGLYGLFQGASLCTFFWLMLWGIFAAQQQRFLKGSAPGKSALAVGFAIVTIVYALCYLSAYYHILGTDKVGEDVFYQTIKSIRTGLVIGTLTTLIMLPMAILFGILAGFFQGWIDDLIQYLYTTLNSIPSVLLIAASILMVQVYMATHEEAFTSVVLRADMRLLFLCMILGVTSWTGLCRLLRAETLKLREMEYVQAARALGVKQGAILARHILPNVMHIVLISVVLDFSALVLAEAVLSYINIGVDPTTYSWGNMINGARLEMAREPVVWWSLTAAFVFMFILVLAANLFADVVQDAFDPRRSRSDGV